MRPGIRVPGPDEIEGAMMQRLFMMSLAKNQETFLGRLHCVSGHYDDSDILLFDQVMDEKSMLVVRIRRPYRVEALAEKVAAVILVRRRKRKKKEKENLQ